MIERVYVRVRRADVRQVDSPPRAVPPPVETALRRGQSLGVAALVLAALDGAWAAMGGLVWPAVAGAAVASAGLFALWHARRRRATVALGAASEARVFLVDTPGEPELVWVVDAEPPPAGARPAVIESSTALGKARVDFERDGRARSMTVRLGAGEIPVPVRFGDRARTAVLTRAPGPGGAALWTDTPP